eukprot:TRINITY_DN5931_c0_g1_i1.p1 TRINITY_DN5931_c0_g1~~TRINITY_DN5931_c0_g1_i1.p1  ORF type:complete len:1258 (-),score=308.08 TRINITY_DN5931_c0_g1_i1:218-3991(-)
MTSLADLKNSLGAEWNALNLSVWGGLNAKQKSEILQVQELFLLYIGGNTMSTASLPEQIKFIKEKSGFLFIFTTKSYSTTTKSSAIQFLASVWEDRMKGSGQLRGYAIDIISDICAYQQAKDINTETAECMFLEELKHWATYELALYALNKDNLKCINNRVRYMEQVLAQKSLFYSSRWESRTVQQIILETCLQLKYSVIPEIKNDLAIQSAREKLAYLRAELKLALQHGVYFLYHVFRDSGKITPESITIAKILRQAGPEFMTGSGELLFHIMSSGAFQEVFPDALSQLRARLMDHTLEDEAAPPPNKMDTATLFTPDGYLCLPLDLWTKMTKREPPKGSVDCVLLTKERLYEVFSKDNSNTGLEAGFLSHPYIAEQYLKTHGTIQELAKFVQIIIKAEKCAAAGGDLLIYGFANKQLNSLLDTYRSLVKKTRAQFEILMRIAELRFQQLVNQNRAQHTRNTWIPHYRNIHTKMYKLDHQLNRTEECVEEILNCANSLTLYERFQTLQRDTEDFITTADSYAGHLNGVLKLPYNEVVSQKILITGQQMPFPDLLLQEKGEHGKRGFDEDWPTALKELESKSESMLSLKSAPPRLRRGFKQAEPEKPPKVVTEIMLTHNGMGMNSHVNDGKTPIVPGLFKCGLPPGEQVHVPGLIALKECDLDSGVNTKIIDFSKQHLAEDDFLSFRTQLRLATQIAETAPDETVDILMQMNNLNASAVIHLLSTLSNEKVVEKVRYLNLSSNPLETEIAAKAIEKFISLPNCKLQHLDISNCGFDDVCLGYIFSALRLNYSLTVLMAQDNYTTDKSVQSLCLGLLANPASKVTQVYLDDTRSEEIPYTGESISQLNSLLRKRKTLTVQLHNDAIPLNEINFKYADAFNAFGRERMRRVQVARQKRRETGEIERNMTATLEYFEDLIHVCQVYVRSTSDPHIPLKTIHAAFQNGAYGVVLPEGLNVVNKYIRAAETLCVVMSGKTADAKHYFWLHPAAHKWKVREPFGEKVKQEDLARIWQHMMTGLVLFLSAISPRDRLLKQLASWGPLREFSEQQIDEVLELCIFRGIILMDNYYCLFNTNTQDIPVDYTKFPGYHVAVFAPGGKKAPSTKKKEEKKESSSSSKKKSSTKDEGDKKEKSKDKSRDKSKDKSRDKSKDKSKDKKEKSKEKEETSDSEELYEEPEDRGRDRDNSPKKKRRGSRSISVNRMFSSPKKKRGEDEDKKKKKKDVEDLDFSEEEDRSEKRARRRSSSISSLKKSLSFSSKK